MTAVSRIDRHLQRTERRSSRNVRGANIRNPIPDSRRRTHEADLRCIERPDTRSRLEGHGGAFGQLVEPAVAYGIPPERVRLAILAAHRPGAPVSL